MGNTLRSPPTPYATMCTIMRTGDEEFVVSGDMRLLREYFESDPEQWLRCLAQKGKDKDGKTKK